MCVAGGPSSKVLSTLTCTPSTLCTPPSQLPHHLLHLLRQMTLLQMIGYSKSPQPGPSKVRVSPQIRRYKPYEKRRPQSAAKLLVAKADPWLRGYTVCNISLRTRLWPQSADPWLKGYTVCNISLRTRLLPWLRGYTVCNISLRTRL